MRITELFSGFGLGGAEIASVTRTRYAPASTHTTILVAGSLDYGGRESDPSVENWEIKACGRGIREQTLAIAETEPDVLVINTPRQTVQLLLSPFRLPSCRIVVVAHNEVLSDHLSLSGPLSTLMRLANPRADLHIAVSKAAASGPWCWGARRIAVCHLGADFRVSHMAHDVSWPEDCSVRLLTLSRLTAPKNLSSLVKAVAASVGVLRSAGAHLRIVGEGPQLKRLMAEVSALGVSDLVSFAGITYAPGDWLQSADWLLIPSVAEGGPLTLYEGMQAGIRVLGTPTGAIPDVIASDPESILLEGSNEVALGTGIEKLLAARPHLSSADRAGRMVRGRVWSAESLAPTWYRALASIA